MLIDNDCRDIYNTSVNDSALFRPHEIRTMKKVGSILFIGAVIVFGGSAILGHQNLQTASSAPAAAAAPVKPAYTMDPEIAKMAADLGINQAILAQAIPVWGDSAAACNTTWAAGCTSGTGITLKHMASESQNRTNLAHEYLHYVWRTQMTPAEKDQISTALMAFYSRYKTNFDRRMADYIGKGYEPGSAQWVNELHSFVGTEISDWRMPPVLLDHYKQWLPNRSALPSYF
jgi:hypothetical protein